MQIRRLNRVGMLNTAVAKKIHAAKGEEWIKSYEAKPTSRHGDKLRPISRRSPTGAVHAN